jgi:hypothetical protein
MRDPWIDFVRQHYGEIPPPAPDLEERIVAQVRSQPRLRRPWWLGWLGLGMVIPVGWGVWRSHPPLLLAESLSDPDLAAFVVEAWTVEDPVEESLWLEF